MTSHKSNKIAIKGRLKELFGIPNKLLPKLKKQLHDVYVNIKIKKITPDLLHRIVVNLFSNDFFPSVSHNIHTDKNNYAVIMGGVAFNMNIPAKLPFYKLETDDVDLKIYTTDINYLKVNSRTNIRVLSVFKFSIIICCMYLKQILEYMKTISINESHISKYSHTQKQHVKTHIKPHVKPHHKHIKPDANTKDGKPGYKIKYHKHTKNKSGGGYGDSVVGDGKKSMKTEKPGSKNIKAKKFADKGELNDYKIFVQLKKKNELNINKVIETIELTSIDYTSIFNKIMTIIDNPDLLITIKIVYNISFNSNINIKSNSKKLTFSDSQIFYPNKEHPGFYAYYLMNNKQNLGKSLETLIHENIPIDKIMETKSCGNNCRYLSIKTLLVDTALMLSYADYLAYEDLDNSKKSKSTDIFVPVGYLFKYYKYLTKYLRLFIIKKYYEGTLNGKFQNDATKLWQYVMKNLNINTSLIENDPINISFKKILNKFHQNLFVNQSLITEYPLLQEVVDTYATTVFYINSSRALFKNIDNTSGHSGKTLESITIQLADKALLQSTHTHNT